MSRAGMTRVGLVAAAAVAASAVIPGCTVGPDYRPPTTQVSATWTEPLGRGPTTQPVTTTRWWTTFDDPQLDDLIERAARANLDLRLAESRVREARLFRRLANADYYPTVDAVGSYSRSRASQGIANRPNFPGQQSETNLWTAGFDAAWEVDVFGGVRRGVEAATAEVQSAVEARNSILVSLFAETAANYVQLRGQQERLRIAQGNLVVQRQSLDLTRSRFEAGLTNELDVTRAQAQVATTESVIPPLVTAIRATVHRIELLLGQQPGTFTEEELAQKPIPGTPPQIPVGLPSDLLRRRPDVRQAERALAAATARVGVATADLFPRFALTGNAGLQAGDFGDLGNASSAFYSIGPGIRWPIFNAGRIRANIAIAGEQQEQAFTRWEQAVLNALADTETALVAYTQEQHRFERLAAAVAANQRSVDLARQRYDRGLEDFLSVLDAQRALFVSEDALVQSREAVSTNLVQLYKALGGGWEEPVAATPPTTQPLALR